MKTAEKLAAGWLLTLGFMFMTHSFSAIIMKHNMLKPIPAPATIDDEGPLPGRDYRNIDALPQINANIQQGLVFGVPTLVLGGWLSLGLYRESRKERKAIAQQANERLQGIFYEMLQESNGRISVLGFAIQTELPATVARKYLDEQAVLFNASFRVSEEGSISYNFDV
jgi:hypothetical protein